MPNFMPLQNGVADGDFDVFRNTRPIVSGFGVAQEIEVGVSAWSQRYHRIFIVHFRENLRAKPDGANRYPTRGDVK